MRHVGIHRWFIAPRYRRGCPAVTPDRLHNSVMAAGFVLRSGKRQQACCRLPGGSSLLRVLSYS